MFIVPQFSDRMNDNAESRQALNSRSNILNEELFRGALIRERKRSDRSSQPFGVLLLRIGKSGEAPLSLIGEAAVAAVLSVKRECDIPGWVESGSVMGLIMPGIRGGHHGRPWEGVDVRLRKELTQRLSSDEAGAVLVQVYHHPPPGGRTAIDPKEIALPLYPDCAGQPKAWMSYEHMKRCLDVVGSAALLAMLSPLLLLIALLVKLTSPGPVIFRQVRVGHMMKPFTMLKFRTMYLGVDHGIHQEFVSQFINAGSHAQLATNGGVFKLTNDPRVSPIGRLLRKTSLDELPQLWNVFRGDMSLVGPRPPLSYELEAYKQWHLRRVLDAKPGITGLWQVAGRSRTSFDEMVRLDLQYARQRSLWTDIKILLATPAAVISGKGAC